jgi:lipid-binding SYLF domain-containing protein
MRVLKNNVNVLMSLVFCLIFILGMTQDSFAATGGEIDASVDATLQRFYSEVKNGRDVIKDAKGVLVFPNVYKAGFLIGGQYGQGALRINGKTVDYYSTTAGSFGFQFGAQKKSIIVLFMGDEALNSFRKAPNWVAGVDASIAVINIGAAESIDTAKFNQPILAFIIDQKGLMYNLTLEGSKFTKLNK